jgi:hypothetical protein
MQNGALGARSCRTKRDLSYPATSLYDGPCRIPLSVASVVKWRTNMDDSLRLVLQLPDFWEDERFVRLNNLEPLGTQLDVFETRGGFGWKAEWACGGARKFANSESWFDTVKAAKIDMKRCLRELRFEQLSAATPPARISMNL